MKNQKGISTIAGITIFVVVAVFAFGGVFAYEYYLEKNEQKTEGDQNTEPTACTMEAKVCPDGSSVGRTGPNCEFTECPIVDQTAGWKTYSGNGFSFKYPQTDIGKRIYSSAETVFILPIAEEGMNTNIDGKVLNLVIKPKVSGSACVGLNYYTADGPTNVVINGIQFSKQSGGEGAAGHGYRYEDYTTEKNNICITMSFVISSYNDLQMPVYNGGKAFVQYNFLEERPIFDQIMSTFKFTN